MDTTSKPEVSYTDFLKTIQSPQFRNNSERLYYFLQAIESGTHVISHILGTCRKEYLNIFWALENLLFLRDLRTKGVIKGEGYAIQESSLIKSLAWCVETDYQDKLYGFERIYGDRKFNKKRVEEIRKSIRQLWKEASGGGPSSTEDDISSFNEVRKLELRGSMRFEKFIVDWMEKIIFCLPKSGLSGGPIDHSARPIKIDAIEHQINQLVSILDTGRDLLTSLETGLSDEFIVALLISRVSLDNKLYRDIYNVLLLYNKLPEELVNSHNVNIASNPYVRENYIKQRVNRLIEQEPDLKLWYKTIVKSAKKKKQ